MNLTQRQQNWIAVALALLIAATHGHHFGTLLHLPPATWAVFFAAGFYLRRAWIFAALVAEVVVIDYFAITAGGVSAFCVSPAYALLLPAYGTLWMAGRWYAGRFSFNTSTLPALGASLAASVTLAEMFSSGGFYFFSGRFADTSLVEFATRLVKYFPYTLQSFAFWAGVVIAVHVAFSLAQTSKRNQA